MQYPSYYMELNSEQWHYRRRTDLRLLKCAPTEG